MSTDKDVDELIDKDLWDHESETEHAELLKFLIDAAQYRGYLDWAALVRDPKKG
jgi:hypothetical protein